MPDMACPCCGEIWAPADIEETTWQQWQCPCCGSWNDRPHVVDQDREFRERFGFDRPRP